MCRFAVGKLGRTAKHERVGDQRDQRRDDGPYPAGNRSAESFAQFAPQDCHNEISVVPGPGERLEQESDEKLKAIVVARDDPLAIDKVHDRCIGRLSPESSFGHRSISSNPSHSLHNFGGADQPGLPWLSRIDRSNLLRSSGWAGGGRWRRDGNRATWGVRICPRMPSL